MVRDTVFRDWVVLCARLYLCTNIKIRLNFVLAPILSEQMHGVE